MRKGERRGEAQTSYFRPLFTRDNITAARKNSHCEGKAPAESSRGRTHIAAIEERAETPFATAAKEGL